MSSYIQRIGTDKFYCIDDFFGQHHYGYIKMTSTERMSDNPWATLDIKSLKKKEGKEGIRKIYSEQEMRSITKREYITTH